MNQNNLKTKIILVILGILAISAVAVWRIAFNQIKGDVQQNGNLLKVTFCDVGQGDAELIQSPAQFDVLIDGGPDDSVLACLGNNLPYSDRDLEMVILTHPDADHLTGLVSVLQRYKVKEILATGVSKDSATFKAWETEIKNQNIPVKKTKAGDQYDLDNGIILKVLSPDDTLLNSNPDINETSIVAQLINQKIKILFSGDAQSMAQNSIIAKNYDVASDILKIPHHGSVNGLTAEFFSKIQPKIAIISVGANNRYGHPHQSILDKLKSQAVQIYRTDQNGEIDLTTDGLTYDIKTEK